MEIQNMPYSWLENLSVKITDLHAAGYGSDEIFHKLGFSAHNWPGGAHCTPEMEFINACIGGE